MIRNTIYLVLTILTAVLVGCDSGSSYTPSYTSSSSSDSEVMSESDMQFTIDHMVGQGADRQEAEQFVRTLNDAQKDWEAGN